MIPRAAGPASIRQRLSKHRWSILAAFVIAIGLTSVATRAWPSAPRDYTRNDFSQDYVAAKEWFGGGDPYQPIPILTLRHLGRNASLNGLGPDQPDPHVPAQILLLSPLAVAPYRLARLLWLLIVSSAFATALGLMARAIGASLRASITIAVGALALPIVQTYLQLIQFEGIIVLLLVLAWLALRTSHETRAGMALGLATALKVYPAIMVVPLLRMRRYRAAATMVATAAIVVLIALLVFGVSNTGRFITEGAPGNYRFWRGSPLNLSLASAPFRWLSSNPWRPTGIDQPSIATALSLMIIALGVLAAAKSPARRTNDLFWATIPWMLLTSPLSWEFSLILTLPVSIMLAVRHFEHSRWVPFATAIPILILLVGLPQGIKGVQPGEENGVRMLIYMIPTLALLALAIMEWRMLTRPVSAPEPAILSRS